MGEGEEHLLHVEQDLDDGITHFELQTEGKLLQSTNEQSYSRLKHWLHMWGTHPPRR